MKNCGRKMGTKGRARAVLWEMQEYIILIALTVDNVI
jgi:hypothetical protein